MKGITVKIWIYIEKITYMILNALFKLMHRKLTDEEFENVMQFVKFGTVGISNTIVHYVLYAVCLLIFQKYQMIPKIDYIVAQMIAFVLSVLWSFYWNNKMVFVVQEGQQRSVWRALLKTYVSYSFTGLFLNSILLMLWVKVFHISEFLGPVVNLMINVPINFLINKFWAFKTKASD